jgi:hypothetical protein
MFFAASALLVSVSAFAGPMLPDSAQPGDPEQAIARSVTNGDSSIGVRREAIVAAGDSTRPRVRALDAQARALLDAGMATETVGRLLDALDATDVVVYVRTTLDLKTRGVLTFVSHAAPLTYVLVRVDLRQNPRDRIAILAHELTHALEIAGASPPVRSEAELASLYARIGVRAGGTGEFESAQALSNERRARLEQDRASRMRHALPGG